MGSLMQRIVRLFLTGHQLHSCIVPYARLDRREYFVQQGS